jgi:hypothetical protein
MPSVGDQNNMSQELIAFMESIREQENAGGNYQLKHKPTTIIGYDGQPVQVQALGAYGILDINWDKWAEEAGYAGANWKVPEMQDIVAAYKFTEYYNTYGSWDLVAVAWYAGPARAKKAKELGIDSVGDIGNIEGFGPNVQEYVNSVLSKYEDNLETASNPTVESYIQQSEQQTIEPNVQMEQDNLGPTVNPAEQYAAQLISALVPRNLDFEAQVPQQAGNENVAQVKTQVNRDESITMQDVLDAIE